MNCRVCNVELKQKYSRCPVCGYSNKVVLTVSNDDSEEYKQSEDYRQNILANIQNISVTANAFQYNNNNRKMEEAGYKSLFKPSLNGSACSEDMVFSTEWIAHFNDETEIDISYDFAGKKKLVTAYIRPVAMEGLWYLGLRINPKLQLEIGLCVVHVDNSSSHKKILLNTVDLDLHV